MNRCPNCGRFIENDPDGFYDREFPYHETAQIVAYCDEKCCDEKRSKDRVNSILRAHRAAAATTEGQS